jgi:hypothetical protein
VSELNDVEIYHDDKSSKVNVILYRVTKGEPGIPALKTLVGVMLLYFGN